jgi:hypothetical protein
MTEISPAAFDFFVARARVRARDQKNSTLRRCMASTKDFFRIGLPDVLLAQSLFFFVARPTDEILAVAGHDRRWTDQRACELRAVGAGMEKVPAT